MSSLIETPSEPDRTNDGVRSSPADLWAERKREWERRLRRLDLDAGPGDEPLEKFRTLTIVLSMTPCLIGLIGLGLFIAFGRPFVGLLLAGGFTGGLLTLIWLEFRRVAVTFSAYLQEREAILGESVDPSSQSFGSQ